ncbi:hypothetical protein QPK87_25500 [Kamptonema cortianum]|nr:hypothetical protein [Oscillatoria laete-virens]MDK3159892.1 hypothetical protein [Kamptonema cortianum]MDL5050539.1 hypothetical protein [Oscillatoria amoena NRMC-F 0135]MDL5055551.1 hypothetical protein [Oscillatoria laete-virens NRMC-F 0139]
MGRSHYILKLLVVLAAIGTAGHWLNATEPVSLESVAKRASLTDADLARMRQGQVVYRNASGTRPNQLFVSAFFLQKHPLADFEAQIRAGRIVNTAQSALAATAVESALSNTTIADILNRTLTDDEAQRYQNAAPGLSLNLSTDELSLFQSVKSGDTPLKETIAPILSGILEKRYNDYLTGGCKAIAPYARSSGSSSPGKEIVTGAGFVPTLFPDMAGFKDIVSNFPGGQPPGAEEFFQFICQRIESRPDYILGHFSFYKPDTASFIAISRQFYVSHSYNCLIIVVGAVETPDGLFVFYYNSTFTDLVTGFIGGVKKSVGQSQMKGDIVKQLDDFRASFDSK